VVILAALAGGVGAYHVVRAATRARPAAGATMRQTTGSAAQPTPIGSATTGTNADGAGGPSSAGHSSDSPTGRTPTAPASLGSLPPLAVSYAVSARKLLSYTVTITLHNPATAEQSWSTVRVSYTGVNLSVTNVPAGVEHSGPGWFFPSAGDQRVAGDGSYQFSFMVTAVAGTLLGDVRAVSLAPGSCP
jgi:hypothetical protein